MATDRKRNNSRSNHNRNKSSAVKQNTGVRDEIVLIAVLAGSVFLFLCNFGIMGVIGQAISHILFGLFGFLAYVVPVLLFLSMAFRLANRGQSIATIKLVAGGILFFLIGIVLDMAGGASLSMESYEAWALYQRSVESKGGGGVICGTLAYLFNHFLDRTGTILVVIVLALICIVIITEKSLLRGVKNGSRRVYESAALENDRRRERAEKRRIEEKQKREEEKRRLEQEEQEKILRMDKKVAGVMLNPTIEKDKKETTPARRDDMHEIMLDENATLDGTSPTVEVEKIRIHTSSSGLGDISELRMPDIPEEEVMMETEPVIRQEIAIHKEGIPEREKSSVSQAPEPERETKKRETSAREVPKPVGKPKKYIFPSINLLKKNENKNGGDSASQLRETAIRLQETLKTFGVKVTVTDISQGPAVTRYELQPEVGVKVSKIVGLADDIKLNLAATDIRIEAPIPGKAAVGIEVPNKENSMVSLRELLESKEFKNFPSNLAFAVGKDIAGKTVVTDIAKMPHMLIAGATGSGKSVCINTLIMSILYKASPEDVKLIMVDPKVVELSVYNGIPHLLIPVVTDPKKAAAALHWGVAEMTDRYKKFADYNVRDLKGFNKLVESKKGDPDMPPKMPQIVIIVDELADLMMVAPGEVEESICRLAQLARAAGIHLVIATQRPSVDVITGLIKANMPSRVAFAVSSGVDSRTILDMNGAEKLLGKGDMLFYPQGYPKPARIQGAFVSDGEVADVVDFLKNQAIGNTYGEDVEEQIQNIGSGVAGAGAGSATERDDYFVEAGRFIIDKDKASIGLLQRAFKIGFNRAARIMDQLYEAGVVGEEEGTKPRKILMSMEEFEQYIEECV